MGIFNLSRNEVDDGYQRANVKSKSFLQKSMVPLAILAWVFFVVASVIMINDKKKELAAFEEA